MAPWQCFMWGWGLGIPSPYGNGDPQVQSVNPTGDGAKSNVFSIVAAAKPDAPGRPVVDRRVGWLDGWMVGWWDDLMAGVVGV